MNGLRRISRVILSILVFIVLAGCNYQYGTAFKAITNQPPVRASWLAYWDMDAGGKDLKEIGSKLDRLSYFGAYFDKDDCLFLPPEIADQKNKLKTGGKYETYLTFVNDRQNADGSVIQKDRGVIRRLLSNDILMDSHVDEIIAMTRKGGYNGIEIDYEKIWKDEDLGRSFLRFTQKLYQKAVQNHLKVRIVLEPSAPFSMSDFLSGPEYVVMFYNLYGLHSQPGPKANKEFIQRTISRMEALPGDKSAAFSTGGCIWGTNGKKSYLTEAEAKRLAVQYDAKRERDEDSRCIVFKYQDKGVAYQVWYADVETLNYWISLAQQQGVNNISLWRLGGNADINRII